MCPLVPHTYNIAPRARVCVCVSAPSRLHNGMMDPFVVGGDM
jgi:hypothetical protein